MAFIFDSHAHYENSRFDSDREELLQALPARGVGAVLCAGCTLESSRAIAALCRRYPFVFGSAGIHPQDCRDLPADYIAQLQALFAENPKLRAVGEIGLDYHGDDATEHALQQQVFEEQLILAAKLDLPVIIHARQSTQDYLKLLHAYRPKGVVHCFSGSAETAREVLDLGMYIGFTGVVTFKNAENVRRSASCVPLDRLLIETDAPYMAPEPYRGRRCDSSMLRQTAQVLADIKGVSTEKLLTVTYQNAVRVYGLEDIL